MALISVLLVTVVMLGLAGAFFVAHKSDLALMTSAGYREQTKNCGRSVAHFVQDKLQKQFIQALAWAEQASLDKGIDLKVLDKTELVTVNVTDSSAYGAALLAGVGAG